MPGFLPANLIELLTASLIFFDEVLGKGTVLNSSQQLLHCVAGLVRDDKRTCSVVAVLGGVRTRVAHVGQSATIDKIDGEFQFMQAFKVSNLRLIAGFNQCFESGLNKGSNATAENGLFTE